MEVNCSVSACYFWKLGNICNADSIWVRRQGAPARAELEMSEEFLEPNASAPITSDDTCCQTYRPRSG